MQNLLRMSWKSVGGGSPAVHIPAWVRRLREDPRTRFGVISDVARALVGHNADSLPSRASAGRGLAGRKLDSATVWELDIAADEWPASFENVFGADGKESCR
jgi:hypothetical protein